MSEETFNDRSAFPLKMYVEETPFRRTSTFFETMKSLAHLTFESFTQFDTFMTPVQLPVEEYFDGNSTVKVNFADY